MRKASFAPLVGDDCRVLILGSLPGERSLAERRYYAHPQNRFWHLVGKAIGVDLVARDYEARLAALRAHAISLWDVVATARREGSLDSAIRDAEANCLHTLVARLPHLQLVAYNGRKAEKLGQVQLAQIAIAQLALPSSSPAYAAMPLAEKESRWAQIREFLETTRDPAH